MKRILTIIILFISFFALNAQPKSIHYKKEYDFFVNVLSNPNSRLYDFLCAGLNSRNAFLKEANIYINSQECQQECRQLGVDISTAYNKIKASWEVLLEIENTDISIDGFGKYMFSHYKNNIFAPRNCPNPELKHKLSIVPLKLEEY